ncbi:MAG TPA: ribosome silencing factor, partial [Opitutales bacterium]|nr:ribosome silencing factor [Opitutales bacterium]
MDTCLTKVQEVAQALLDKKALDVRILDLTGKSSITDYFVIATANSEPHLRALRKAVEDVVKGHTKTVGIDYQPLSGWLVVDAYQFMVHLFVEDKRELYGL